MHQAVELSIRGTGWKYHTMRLLKIVWVEQQRMYCWEQSCTGRGWVEMVYFPLYHLDSMVLRFTCASRIPSIFLPNKATWIHQQHNRLLLASCRLQQAWNHGPWVTSWSLEFGSLHILHHHAQGESNFSRYIFESGILMGKLEELHKATGIRDMIHI